MTLTKFDSRHIDRYHEPRFLVHFQWGTNEKVYRYALVETINESEIDHTTKNKKKMNWVYLKKKFGKRKYK